MSCLLTTTMPEMKRVIDLLTERGHRDNVLVLVGGAPVTPEFAQRIGADHYAKDGPEAVEVLNRRFG
jgi:5-methyltetrahydrofolate--homocysteine methyltransferase